MKYYLKFVGLGVCIGILLTVLRIVLPIDEEAFMRGYWITGAVVVGLAAAGSLFYTGRYRKRMQGALALFEKGEIGPYMEEVKDMLRSAKGRSLRNTLQINLSAGYCEMGQFDRAAEILEGLSGERLQGVMGMVYRLNLCVCYFYTSQNARAMELYHASGKLFGPYRKSRFYGGNIALLDMLAAIEEGRYRDAENMLADARKTWDFPRLQKDYRQIAEKLSGNPADGLSH